MNVNELGTIYKEVVVKARNAAEAEKTENGRFLVFDAAKKNLEELNNNFMVKLRRLEKSPAIPSSR